MDLRAGRRESRQLSCKLRRSSSLKAFFTPPSTPAGFEYHLQFGFVYILDVFAQVASLIIGIFL
ncbi:hypothetical protein RGR602_PC01110 (plasmid) [Rhizobium gallicum bv. gallicum R602sp]|uniref:Uncharacterized protein n=1 Tax=Rhizobium gallicum bv. gallicum R602sp TaxID=1041138 RepID=A0A0B4XDH3_9HYPH|nr:hypothetical protein RGR602_PC01110 [Rhizobium gallicum bv. gallicum R602sp]TDW27172.1 hypothetical protein EV128_112173 [Rhizobium azibense]